MKFHALGVPIVVVALAAAVACSQTPTSPSSVDADSSVGLISQEPPLAPPRADGSLPPPNGIGATRLLAFGDSITYGTAAPLDLTFSFDARPDTGPGCYGDGTAQSYPAQLRRMLAGSHPSQQFSVVNCGWPGEGAVQGASRIVSALGQPPRPQALLLLEGINGLANSADVARTVSALDTILDHARLYNVPVLIATMFQTREVNGHINGAPFVDALNEGIMRIASGRQNVFVVDIHHAFEVRSGLVGNDGLHPTTDGYEQMATWFRATLETAFKVQGSFQ